MELVRSDDFRLDTFQPPDDHLGSHHGASGVAVLLARSLGHHGDAADLAEVTDAEIGFSCLEVGHLECTVIEVH